MASSAPARDAGGADREPTTPILEPRRTLAADLLPVVLLCAAAELVTVDGGRVWRALHAVWGLVRIASPLPGWGWWAVPTALALLLLAAAWAVAFARHRLWRAVAVVALAACLTAPGVALGWLDGSVSAVGHSSPAATRTVRTARRQLRTVATGRPVTILLLGADHGGADAGGRSDTQILVRLDPRTGTVSMLSLPRDLRTDVPGVGVTKLNAAYAYGGAALALRTVHQLTGLSINHFVTIDFSGFWQVVDILGGVYLPIDRRYYVPASADYKSIDLQPGYQLVRAKQALNWVRFRHDQKGDFTRMVRQQLFLREVRRQAGRWSSDWPRLVRMLRAITRQTTSDVDSLPRLLPLVRTVLGLDTSHVYMTHLEGTTPTIDGVSYVTASPAAVRRAVQRFLHPTGAVHSVRHTSGNAAAATSADAAAATGVAASLQTGSEHDWGTWRWLARTTPLTLEAPTAWRAGLSYDQFRAYAILTTSGHRAAAAVVTGTCGWGYWGVQAMRWTDPPAVADPDRELHADGRTYLLFLQGGRLHMVAWRENGTLYWVVNTLSNDLPDAELLGLARSCRPVS